MCNMLRGVMTIENIVLLPMIPMTPLLIEISRMLCVQIVSGQDLDPVSSNRGRFELTIATPSKAAVKARLNILKASGAKALLTTHLLNCSVRFAQLLRSTLLPELSSVVCPPSPGKCSAPGTLLSGSAPAFGNQGLFQPAICELCLLIPCVATSISSPRWWCATSRARSHDERRLDCLCVSRVRFAGRDLWAYCVGLPSPSWSSPET